MSATACEVRNWVDETFEIERLDLFARGVRVERECHCPHCGSVVYSRRHKLCGVCAEPLPATCLFSDEEAQRVRSIMNEERQRHRLWMHRSNFGN